MTDEKPGPRDSEDIVFTHADSTSAAVESIVECLNQIDRVTGELAENIGDFVADCDEQRATTVRDGRPLSVLVDTVKDVYRDWVVDIIEDPDSDLERVIVPSDGGPLVESVISTALDDGVTVVIVPVGPVANVTDQMSEILDDRSPLGQEWSGRPPLGFEVQKGRLVESSEYRRVRAVLKLVRDGELSKRAAAGELDVSRRTIGRALDNSERYGLSG